MARPPMRRSYMHSSRLPVTCPGTSSGRPGSSFCATSAPRITRPPSSITTSPGRAVKVAATCTWSSAVSALMGRSCLQDSRRSGWRRPCGWQSSSWARPPRSAAITLPACAGSGRTAGPMSPTGWKPPTGPIQTSRSRPPRPRSGRLSPGRAWSWPMSPTWSARPGPPPMAAGPSPQHFVPKDSMLFRERRQGSSSCAMATSKSAPSTGW